MEMNSLKHYEIFSRLFEYPGENFKKDATAAKVVFEKIYPDILPLIKDFLDFVLEKPLQTLEELYTRTFDVQSLTTLDLGYVLFGDDYKRGDLLANLSAEHHKANNDCGFELPDNLANLLRLLPHLEDDELRYELVTDLMLPALKKIINDFNVESIELKNKIYKKQHKTFIEQNASYGSIYRLPLNAIYLILKKDFNADYSEPEEKNFGFTRAIKKELDIE